MKEMLTQLCSADGVTGFEGNAAQAAKKLLTPYCDRVSFDRCGSVLGWKSCGKPNAKTVLLDAHIDQIGFMVTDVLEGGFLRFTQVGGIDPRMLLGAEVTILTEQPRYGIIACMPPHLLSAGEQDKAVPIHEMLIDTGLLDAKPVIPIGTPVVFAQPPYALTEGQLTGKCLDDRAGFVAIVQAMRQLKDVDLDVDIVACGSVHEETDSLGALTAAFHVQPDYGIAVDVSHAKTPDSGSDDAFEFGGGVLIGMGPNLHRGLTNQMIKVARAEEIPYQLEVMEGNTGTNAWEMQVVRNGIAMGLLSIPLKYMHTPIETIQLSDVEAVSDLLTAFLRTFHGEVTRT